MRTGSRDTDEKALLPNVYLFSSLSCSSIVDSLRTAIQLFMVIPLCSLEAGIALVSLYMSVMGDPADGLEVETRV